MSGTKGDQGKAPARYFYFMPVAYSFDIKHPARLIAMRLEGIIEALSTKNYNTKGVSRDLVMMMGTVARHIQSDFGWNLAEVYKEVSYVSELGAKKYGIYNYKRGMKWSRIVDALGRHFIHYMCDDFIDEESGKDHRFHMIANICMLLYYVENKLGDNDLEEITNE